MVPTSFSDHTFDIPRWEISGRGLQSSINAGTMSETLAPENLERCDATFATRYCGEQWTERGCDLVGDLPSSVDVFLSHIL